MTTALLLDPIYQAHETAWDHPESPERIGALIEALETSGLAGQTSRLSPRPATFAEIARAHDPHYLESVLAAIRSGEQWLADGDVSVLELLGQSRPPGRGRSGQCLLRRAAARSPCHLGPSGGRLHFQPRRRRRAPCAGRPRRRDSRLGRAPRQRHAGHFLRRRLGAVLQHPYQSPWYPGTGAADETGRGDGAGFTINRPFRARAGRPEIGGAFRGDFLPAVRAFRPQIILLSAGFDSRLAIRSANSGSPTPISRS